MSILASDIVSGAYQLLGRPSQSDLPYQDVLDHAKDVIRGRYLDLKLSARNHTATVGSWATPNDREGSALVFSNGTTDFIPVRMEWRDINAVDSATPINVQIVALEQLNELYRKTDGYRETYAAFYNGFSEIAFSEPREVLLNRQYRLTFESMDDVNFASLSSSAQLPALFITLCKYETALVCLDQVVNETDGWSEKRERLRVTLSARMGQEEQRFDRWRKSLYGNKLVRKTGFRTRGR
jgi:hypothetical protein